MKINSVYLKLSDEGDEESCLKGDYANETYIEGKINILSQSEYPFVFLSTSFISRSILVPILQQMRRHNFSFHQYARCLSHRWIINSIKSIYVLRTANNEIRNFESYATGQYAKYQRNNNRQTRDSPANRANSFNLGVLRLSYLLKYCRDPPFVNKVCIFLTSVLPRTVPHLTY